MATDSTIRLRIKSTSEFLHYQSGPVAVLLTSLFVWPALGRAMDRDLLGQLSMQLATSSLLAPAISLGLSHYLANRLLLVSNGSRAAELLATKLVVNGIYIISIAAILIGLIAQETIITTAIAVSGSTAVFLVCSSLLRGLNLPRMFAALTLYMQVFALLSMGVVAAKHGLAAGTAIYVGLSAGPALVVNVLTNGARRLATYSQISKVLKLATTLVPHLVMAVATMLLMRIVVGFSMGTAAAANYMFASLLIGGALTIAASLDAHWSTRAQSAATLEQLSKILIRNQIRIQLALLVVSLAVILFIFIALDTWLPSTYDRSGVVDAIAMGLPAAALQAAADGRSALLMWLGRTLQISVATATGGLATLVLALVLLPNHGWQAAGLCITAGMATRTLLATVFSFQRADLRKFDLYMCAAMALQIVMCAVLVFH